ncbi:MAG: pyruvate, phosphate dikinase [Acidimicrobiia bacterium]
MNNIYSFDQPLDVPEDEALRLLGGKGMNLAIMRTQLDLPVPPGFTITTAAGNEYLDVGWSDSLEDELREHIARLESDFGRSFGGSGEPLLVSVRSGAAVSMPGMMDTILNLGINESNVAALAEACGDADFARNSMGRFRSMYQDIVGGEPPKDPWEALRQAIGAVFRSWNTERARAYRRREGISDHLGTAVTVQAMVFGNLDDSSGTGVLFTRNPATGEKHPYGDVLFRAQGEDVVAGTHATEPVSTLHDKLPDVAEQLFGHAEDLERHFTDVCDIEFTIERAKLYLLQVRVGKRSPQAALEFAVDMAEDGDFPLSRREAIERVAHHLTNPPVTVVRLGGDSSPIATGLPASPGWAVGRIVTTADDAVERTDAGEDVILVRPETSPKDVHGMACARGILTTSGGLASHAAVVARGWGVPAVVGASGVEVGSGSITVGGRTIPEGEWLTIDGQTGEVFAGKLEAETEVSPHARKLLAWARELNIDIAAKAEADGGPMADEEESDVILDKETLVRVLHIKGFATPDELAPVVLSNPATVAPLLEAMSHEGLFTMLGEMYRLSEDGKKLGDRLMEEDRSNWSTESATAALDDFLDLDGRMKEIVTSWQMREVDGEQVLNDHTDEDYDRAILDELAKLHARATDWLAPLLPGLERLETYRIRLIRAAEEVSKGNHHYIASPRIDSYHNIWFELHEDLIQLAGRTREGETEAGRA